ncbi:MAG: outer membrane protein transport protein [Bacteroidota bacterium]
MKQVIKMMTLLAMCVAGQELYAQDEQSIVRYGYTPLSGSARYVGMGGAFNALGGDMTSISYNPAATGVFLSNEFAISLGMNGFSTTSQYLGRGADNLETKINIPSFGIISGNTVKNQASKWKAINFGYSYNRLKDYNSGFVLRAPSRISLSDQIVEDQQGIENTPSGLMSGPLAGEVAYQTFLIDTFAGNTNQYVNLLDTGVVNQNYRTLTKGRIGENLITFGANYDNRLYLGAAIGILGVNFSLEETYKEEAEANTPGAIHSFTYQYNQTTQGTGYNFKVGAIYRVAENLRFGLSYQTPTTFILTDQFYAYGETDNANYEYTTELYNNDYNLVTPGRIGFGAAYLFGKKGLISFDYNRQDFSQAKINNQSFESNADINQLIRTYLGPTNQVKVGGEYRIERLVLRAGFGYQDSPYPASYRVNASASNSFSLGLGYNFDNISLDFGFANTTFKDDYLPYPKTELATIKNSISSVNAGIVFRY